MQAFVLNEKMNLTKKERDLPVCKSGDVILNITRCGVCRTDRKAWSIGQKDLHMPRILGHEIVGTIHQVGNSVDDYFVGERVVLHPGIFCGTCEACKNGLDQLCPEMQIFGFHIDGGYAEYCLIPEKAVASGNLIKLSDKLPDNTAVLAEPLACAINIAESLPKNKESLIIFGGGALGILTAQLWKSYGIKEITVIEPNPWKREKLDQLGFRSCANAEETNDKFDIAINCCPDINAFHDAIRVLKPRGNLGFFSGLTGDDPFDLKTLNAIHYKELRIAGSYGCALRHTKEAVSLLGKGIFDHIECEILEPNELTNHIEQTEKERSIVSIIKF